MTRYAEVIGDPIAQSKSPIIHRFWLEALAMAGDYRAVQVTADALPAYLTERRDDPNWLGCNVTKPLKIAALDHVADPGDVQGGIGAINTVFRGENGEPTGTNTDAAGFFAPLAGYELAGQPVTVIGSGGAARAVLWALARIGTGPVTLLVRNPLKGAGLLARFGLKGRALPIASGTPDAALVVNASSLGMAGEEALSLDLSPLREEALVYDLVYHPLETPLLAAAHARGLETIDGLEMLVGQAAVAFELFFGAAPPRDRDEELRALLLAA